MFTQRIVRRTEKLRGLLLSSAPGVTSSPALSNLDSVQERLASGAHASTTASNGTGSELYATHTELGPLQRGAVAIFSAVGAVIDPKRADLVAALGETTGVRAFKHMRERMLRSPSGKRILEEKPRITNATLAAAADMPPGTFGHAYGLFMGRRHFEADERPPVRFIDDIELAYVAQRARETHDLWHVLFGCPTTVSGELALKAVEFVQTGLPMAALSVLGAQWRLKSEDRQRLMRELVPWAIQAGSRCADLMCLPYEQHFQVLRGFSGSLPVKPHRLQQLRSSRFPAASDLFFHATGRSSRLATAVENNSSTNSC